MLHKRKFPRGKVRVIFAVPALEGVTAVSLLGDFNEWSETATPLVREADGSWSAVLTLDAGRRYQFRYRDDRGEWHNDSAADGYAPNEFGSDNSVLDLTGEAAPAPRNASPARGRSVRPRPRPRSRKAKTS
jgi:1,4-alpha-glucan branching enzyme